MEEQAIACLGCGAAEALTEASPRAIAAERWPVWTPGLQPFTCPTCGQAMVWAAEPRLREDDTPTRTVD